MTTSKPIYASKTLWFNIVTGILAIASVVPHPITAGITAVGNIVLRVWFTEQPIKLRK